MNRLTLTTAAALLGAVLLSGCSHPSDAGFDAQSATPSPTCLVHQTRDPGNRYTAGNSAAPRAVLEMMRYYTANGTKAYCDGQPPTGTDRHWTGLYTTLGGDPTHLGTPVTSSDREGSHRSGARPVR
ncbi:hypothetical protein [Streptomyces kaniharaensis]|uniref:hypothetical protein n=1 Tax=Streptomyces kaniharaensis TaxID=212423 RepID=UPI0018A83FDB|nr:hypothetical protein [Streptomyces kaniharaensis]